MHNKRCLVYEVSVRDYRKHMDELVQQCEAYQKGWTWD